MRDTVENRAKFAEILQFVSRSITGEGLPADVIESYWFVLADEFETPREFGEVAKQVLKTWPNGYMPKPAHFIQATRMDLELIAEQAYNSAKIAAIRYGVYKNIEFEDKAIETTIATLFLSFKEFHDRVAFIDSDDIWIKKDFIRTYKAVVKNKALKPIKLIGYLQSEFKDPVVVGADYSLPLLGVQAAQALPSGRVGELVKKVASGKKVG